MKKYNCLVLLHIVLLLSFDPALSQQVKVVGISDGDSFTVLMADNHQQKIRLYGIDCPEYGQPYFSIAKKYTSAQIFRKKVGLKIVSHDKYGRLVAMVYLPDSSLLNENLLKEGLAWHFIVFDKNLKWQTMEQVARSKKKGLWADSRPPIAPWLWRKKHFGKHTLAL